MAAKPDQTTNAAEQWLDQLAPTDPSVKVRDGRCLRHVRQAADAADASADGVRQAVAQTRANDESWGTIGMVLGASE